MIYNCSYPFSAFLSLNQYVLLLILTFVSFIYMFYKSRIWLNSPIYSIGGIVFILAGGGYNLWTRLNNGCVADPFPFGKMFHFNFADVFINIGLFLLISVYIIPHITKRKGKNDA